MGKPIILVALICIFCGCAKLRHMDELLALQSFSENQDAQDRYLAETEKQFQDLLAEVKQGRLKMGRSQSSIVSQYGEPILVTRIDNDPKIKEELMYRHPAQLFGSEKVFLSFNGKHKLVKAVISPPLHQD